MCYSLLCWSCFLSDSNISAIFYEKILDFMRAMIANKEKQKKSYSICNSCSWSYCSLRLHSDMSCTSLRTADVSPRSSTLRDVSQGGMSATQWQKFHTDDINQCLHNNFGSHRVPNENLFNFTFPLVDFGKVLCSSSNELQQNSDASLREDYIPQILAVLLEIHRVYIWPLQPFVFCLLSVIRKQ